MDAPKYIVVKIFCGLMTMETPIIFPAYVGHDAMARSLGITPDDVLSAGFVGFSPKKYSDSVVEVKAYGKSTSLGVESREEDSNLISKALSLGED